MTTFIGQYYQ